MKRDFIYYATLMSFLLSTSCLTVSSKRVIFFNQDIDQTDFESIETYCEKYPDDNGVFLSYENHYQHVATYGQDYMDWKLVHVVDYAYMVFNPDIKGLTTFTLRLDKGETLKSAFFTIRSPAGEVNSFSMTDLKKTNENKQTVFRLVYPGVEKGSYIKEKFEVVSTSPSLFLEMPLQSNMPCESLNASITYPDWWSVDVKQIDESGPLDLKETRDAIAKTITLTYQKDDVPAIADEPFSPPSKWNTKYISFLIDELHFGGVPHTSPASWQDFSDEFKEYVMDKDATFSSRVQKTAKKLTKDLGTNKEKFEAIIGYVQNELELGHSSVKNFAKLLIDKKGNPYANTALAQRMLASVGITSYYLLIHSSYDGYFDSTFFAFPEMQMPALWVELDKKIYVTLPFVKNLPVDHIPKLFQDQPAIKISKSGEAKRVDVPKGNQVENKTEEFYELTIQDNGEIHVIERKVFYGGDAYSLRKALEDTTEEEKEKILKKMLTYSDGEIGNRKQEFINLDDYKKPFEIKLQYTIDNLITILPDEVIFQTGGLFSPVSDLKTKVRQKNRINPIWIPFDRQVIKEIVINHPISWRVQNPPENLKLQNDLGNIEGDYQWSDGRVAIRQSVSLKKTLEKQEMFADLMLLIGKKSSLNVPTLIFNIE